MKEQKIPDWIENIDPDWYKKKETYIGFLQTFLIIMFGFCIGVYQDNNKTANECNEFIKENYWNDSIVECLREKGVLNYPLPVWDIYEFNLTKNGEIENEEWRNKTYYY